LPIFEEEQRELLWLRIDEWQKHSSTGMSKERYLQIQEQLGREPDMEQCPPGVDDFPDIVIDALNIYDRLGNRIFPDVGYVGKDFTNLPIYIKLYQIDNIELFMEILSRLDAHAIKTSQQELKRAYDKLKRK
jgi:hypothetical protein